MDKKESKIRFKELVRVTGAIAVSSALVLQPVVANSGTGELTVNSGGVNWHLNNNITFATSSSNFGFSEAGFAAGVGTFSAKNDAYDGALSWLVGVPVAEVVDGSRGYRSPGGPLTIDTVSAPTGKIVTGNPQTMSGLTVTGQMFFLNAKPIARSMLILTNPTGAPITVNIVNFNNFGSDSNTTIFNSSSGNATVDSADRWATSFQNPSGGNSSDPVITMAWSSAAAATPGVMSGYVNGDDNPMYSLTVTVPAGATRRVMIFSQLTQVNNSSGSDADWLANVGPATASDAAIFGNVSAMLAAGYFDGITPAERAEVVNWAVPTAVAAVPTLSEWAMMLLGLILAGSAALILQRRRKIVQPVNCN